MGTLLQEFGHDIVLLHFIDKVLKGKLKNLFYIVNSATGPCIDIHFRNPEKNEYTSAFSISNKDFIPEFAARFHLPRDIVEKVDEAAQYRDSEWYVNLSRRIKRDMKVFVKELCDHLGKRIEAMPDAIGIDETGHETIWAEVKFEGLSSKARDSVLKQYRIACERKVPFYLIIPKKPPYGRELTNSWIEKNLPAGMKIYKFTSGSQAVVPKRDEIRFTEVGRVYDR